MKNSLTFFILLFPIALLSQQILIDYQSTSTSLDFVYFGSSLDRDNTRTVNNPNSTGINTSTKVARFIKPANAQTWAGAYTELLEEVDATQGGQICVKVYMGRIGNLALKLEDPSTGGNWIARKSTTKVNQWEELCFDLSTTSFERPFTQATGRTFGKMVLFFDFGRRFSSNQTYYFDDLSYPNDLELISPTSATADCQELIWSDEFTGTSLNTNKWSPQIGNGCPYVCGWGNSELEYYRAENAEVSDGTLKIIAKRENFANHRYTSARIRSIHKGDWTYGRFEASIKLPKGKGIWPAFWMLPTDEVYGGWPQSGEIDIMEYLGHETNVVHGTIHYGPQWPNNKHTGQRYQLPKGNFYEDFHEFAIEWDQEVVRWYIDDVLYATKTAADISPEHWPFDKRFHFILNVAVGGNWPGNPDANTVFPQTMEVDYVRVYKGKIPSLIGNTDVLNRAVGEIYTVENAPIGTTYSWSIPTGASIVSGQRTNSIIVNWGDTTTSGTVSVALGGNICATQTLERAVRVAPAMVNTTAQVLENFDQPAILDFKLTTGTFRENLNNPAPNAVNNSVLVGRYNRNSSQQYDVLMYDIQEPIDAAALVTSNKKFYLDIYSTAPLGTPILLQLENDAAAGATNYPSGRHSRYQAVTTVRNAWERITFHYLDRPDRRVAHESVDNLVLLFAPNSYIGLTYYFDNFEIDCVNQALCNSFTISETLNRQTKKANLDISVFPNPTLHQVTIQLHDFEKGKLQLLDVTGKVILSKTVNNTAQVDLNSLEAGIFFLQVRAYSTGKVFTRKIIKA